MLVEAASNMVAGDRIEIAELDLAHAARAGHGGAVNVFLAGERGQ